MHIYLHERYLCKDPADVGRRGGLRGRELGHGSRNESKTCFSLSNSLYCFEISFSTIEFKLKGDFVMVTKHCKLITTYMFQIVCGIRYTENKGLRAFHSVTIRSTGRGTVCSMEM